MKVFVIFFLFSLSIISSAHEQIKLSDINVLTLNHGYLTNARRSKPIPQLECIGGSAGCKSKYLPNTVQCKNMGSDGYDVQWKCQADLHTNVKFGKVDVSCEGYDYPNDKYVLKGSCGLRYTLEVSSKSGSFQQNESKYDKSSTNGIYFLVFCVVVCAAIYYFCILPSRSPTDVPYNSFGNQSGPGYTSAPPPAGFRAEYTDPPPYESVHRNKYHQARTDTNNQPGFFTGLGVGGLMGYFMGSRTSTNNYAPPHQQSWQPHSAWSDTGYTSGTTRRHDSDDSGEFRTASGYGGTSRR